MAKRANQAETSPFTRKEVFQIRLNRRELATIEAQAKARGLTKTDYIRKAATRALETPIA